MSSKVLIISGFVMMLHSAYSMLEVRRYY